MRIGSLSGSFSPMQLSHISRSGSRVLVPVRPSQTVIAQYRYIAGTPAVNGQQTVPLPRIQLLNSLINNLKSRSQNSSIPPQQDFSQERTDALIKQYATELHQAMKAVPEAFGTLGGSADAGMLFQVSA